ncbi:MAG: hypothetical protein LQ348_006006 [Seirophora lacunosa]|nr:MAG: hypothetical protein LQ348_006006 [Seirophora lacunosa]
MSGLMHKVKDALSGDKHTDESAATSHGTTDSTRGSNPTHSGLGHSSTSGTTDTSGYGAHPGPNSSGLAADRDHLSSGLGHSGQSTGTHGTHGTTTSSDYDRTTGGSGMTGSNTTGSGYGSGTAGPHSSNLANKADPRVDSDLDGRGTHGSSGYDRTTGGSGMTGSGLTGSNTTGSGYGSSDYDRSTGDSGMTGSGLTGSNTTGSGYGSSDYDRTTGGSGMTGSGMTGSGMTGSGMTGSGMTGSGTTGSGMTGSGMTGTGMTGSGTTGSGITGTGMTGTGMTGSGLTGRDTTSSGYGSSTTGPHSSSMANKADPRVDSDRDGRRGVEAGSGGTGSGLTGSSATGHHGHHGGLTGKADDIVHGGDHHTETANRLDPHVAGGRGPIEHATVGDASSGLGGSSDRDGRRGVETGSGTSGGYGSSTDATRGYGSSTDATSGYGSTTSGPHSSSMGNKADPRVDSDRDGRRGLETGSGTSGGYGTSSGVGGTTSGYGSSTDATRGYGSSTGGNNYNDTTSSTGTGSADASGPHKSSMMNKLDPRVDSDNDGSRMK